MKSKRDTSPTTSMSRRNILKTSVGVLAAVSASQAGFADPTCTKPVATPPQTKGPFYPVHDQVDKDADLIRFAGQKAAPKGDLIYLTGKVQNLKCQPLSGVLVEIWQACASGRYNHPADTNPAPLDENFQYWGQALTKADGSFVFRTILPGAYPADVDWTRPPHIHVHVMAKGYKELVSQWYFALPEFQALNESDLILRAIPLSQRPEVLSEALPPTSEMEPSARVFRYTVTLVPIKP